MDKEKAIKKEKAKLKKIFANIPSSKKNLCEKLIDNAAYMAATLEELQEKINMDGVILEAKNGNGFVITQEHPAQKSYTALVAKYTTIINQLSALLPDTKQDTVNSAGENLAAFVAKGKNIELR